MNADQAAKALFDSMPQQEGIIPRTNRVPKFITEIVKATRQQSAQETFEWACKVWCGECRTMSNPETQDDCVLKDKDGKYYHATADEEGHSKGACKASDLREAWEKEHGN